MSLSDVTMIVENLELSWNYCDYIFQVSLVSFRSIYFLYDFILYFYQIYDLLFSSNFTHVLFSISYFKKTIFIQR